MRSKRKTEILLADEVFELRWTTGAIRRDDKEMAYVVDAFRQVVELSNDLTKEQIAAVVAAMVSDYCRRRWRPIEVETDGEWLAEEKTPMG